MLRRGCPLHANKAPARETNHYALVCMRARRRVEVYVIGDRLRFLGHPEAFESLWISRGRMTCHLVGTR
jgi:hypothetical protein